MSTVNSMYTRVMDKKFWDLVQSANSIDITSHISPDADAVCSILLLGQTLKSNFPDKKIEMLLEEKPASSMDFLGGYQDIKFGSIFSKIKDLEPQLFILIDINKIERSSRKDWQAISEFIDKNDVKTAIIDHHQPQDKDESDVFINNFAPAAVQEIYSLCFERNNLKKPKGYVDVTLFGLISDTGRFKYYNQDHRETFRIVSDLIDAGGSIEVLENKMSSYTKDQLEVLSHLLTNTEVKKGYTLSFVTDGFAEKWQSSNKSLNDYSIAISIFVNQFIRSVEKNEWGFVVYPDIVSGKGNYSISLRSISSAKDVSAIANELGGGGHKASAGVKLGANSIDDAIKKIQSAI